MDIEKILNRLKNRIDNDELYNTSIEYFNELIIKLNDKRFIKNEILQYIMCTEEANPELNEDAAIQRMEDIVEKVKLRLNS